MTLPDRQDTRLTTLANGVRVVTIHMPWLASASASVFVRTGSGHESARLSGISHVVEHMAFKGTTTRDAARINIDAERLGAEVNAHTDKDHTAYHLSGMARDASEFVRMLGDIVRRPTFPAAELERERQVILQEYLEDEEDPMSTAFRQFDKLCYGAHPMAQAVIGTRRNIERFTRDDLLAYVDAQYSGANVVVGVAGNVDHDAIVREAEAAFGDMPAGTPHAMDAPTWLGGVKANRLAGCSQSHVVLGYPIASMKDDQPAASVAAALFGEGMSSPLMNEIRERRGLVYYAACSADIMEACGQFVIEASTTPDKVDELLRETHRLLQGHAASVGAIDLERARNQIAVRQLRALERPVRRVEEAALDLFVHRRVRSSEELRERVEGVSADQVREAFAGMLAAPPVLALAGKLGALHGRTPARAGVGARAARPGRRPRAPQHPHALTAVPDETDMLNVSIEDIQRTISQLGEGERRDTEIEIAVRRFAADPTTVRRLVDWIPEAFGYVLLPHVADMTLPTTFTAKAKDGTWKSFSFDREPIFGETVTIASAMYKESRAIFSNVAKRSAMVTAVNNALNAGQSLTGSTIAGPALVGIPAEFYDARPKAAGGFWRKLVG